MRASSDSSSYNHFSSLFFTTSPVLEPVPSLPNSNTLYQVYQASIPHHSHSNKPHHSHHYQQPWVHHRADHHPAVSHPATTASAVAANADLPSMAAHRAPHGRHNPSNTGAHSSAAHRPTRHTTGAPPCPDTPIDKIDMPHGQTTAVMAPPVPIPMRQLREAGSHTPIAIEIGRTIRPTSAGKRTSARSRGAHHGDCGP
jgi:hypothetical protein